VVRRGALGAWPLQSIALATRRYGCEPARLGPRRWSTCRREAGRHSHTADYHAVGVQGTWVHTNDGDALVREFPPGSYVMQPGKQIHNHVCKGTTDRILFVHQHAPGDFIPARTP